MIVHEAERTGPPVYALDLTRRLRASTDLDLRVLLLASGPLESAFAAAAPTMVLDAPGPARQALEASDLVYVNTAASIRGLRVTGAAPRRVLSHVHEMDIALRHYLDPADLALLLQASDRFLVGPERARRNLVDGHGVDPNRVHQVPYFLPEHDRPSANAGARVRRELGIPSDALVVGACGTREWRKAPDLFAQVGWHLDRRRLPPTHLIWLGSRIASPAHWDEATDTRLLGLEGRLHFVENQPSPLPHMAAYDVLALTSREDTFPLVALEAGSLAVPVVCFDTSGIPEMLAACDGGATVAYPDLAGFADAVAAYLVDEAGRKASGRRLRDHIATHHGIERCARLVAEAIGAALADG